MKFIDRVYSSFYDILVNIGVLLPLLKLWEVPPIANWSWYKVLVPFWILSGIVILGLMIIGLCELYENKS